jgi:hypothetical protein
VNKSEDLKQTLTHQPSLFESYRDYRRLEVAIRDHITPCNILEEPLFVVSMVRSTTGPRSVYNRMARLTACRVLRPNVAR